MTSCKDEAGKRGGLLLLGFAIVILILRRDQIERRWVGWAMALCFSGRVLVSSF